jgi:hypothetical protein
MTAPKLRRIAMAIRSARWTVQNTQVVVVAAYDTETLQICLSKMRLGETDMVSVWNFRKVHRGTTARE